MDQKQHAYMHFYGGKLVQPFWNAVEQHVSKCGGIFLMSTAGNFCGNLKRGQGFYA